MKTWITTRLTHLIVLVLTLPIIRKDIVTAFARLWLHETDEYVVIPKEQFVIAQAVSGFTRTRLRKAGGGNASKLRDPRKTMIRLVRKFERMLEGALKERPDIPANLLPRSLRP